MSDHQGLYIDLDTVILFGGATDDPVAASSWGFTSKNEKKTKLYLDALNMYFKDHKICVQIDRLIEAAPSLTRTELKQRYNGFDNDITRGMLAAERKVRLHKSFKFKWSLELDKAGYCL